MFSFIKDKLNKIYSSFSSKISGLFKKEKIDDATLQELEALLISADLGVKVTKDVLQKLKDRYSRGEIKKGEDLKAELQNLLLELITAKKGETDCSIYLLVGINGSGKTTFAGKLANMQKKSGRKTLLVAADTFRAAAVDQLIQWGQKSGVEVVIGKENQDPASVVFAGCEKYKNEKYDCLIIDTAGRLQTKVNLMKELEKVRKVITKVVPEQKVCTLLTIDAMLGQNSLQQAKVFHESTNVDGLVLTKMDGTGKAGIVFAIVQELQIPITFICFGEDINSIKYFDPQEFVEQLLRE